MKLVGQVGGVIIYPKFRNGKWDVELYEDLPHPEAPREPFRIFRNMDIVEISHTVEHTVTLRGRALLPYEKERIEVLFGHKVNAYLITSTHLVLE
ncbi:MAG TPA: hypothetical protein ENG51_00465 [Deltaproteobacteria bacterium]|nr:hypothetical protein [Deltaproteobacteria bacterium]